MTEHQHIGEGINEDGRVLRMHLNRDHGVEPGMLADPAAWHRAAHGLTGNQQRAALVLRHQLGPEDVERVAHALDEAEQRGRAELAAELESLARTWERAAELAEQDGESPEDRRKHAWQLRRFLAAK